MDLRLPRYSQSARRPLSILQVHNRYRSHIPSGENESADLLSRAWANLGVDVANFHLSSDDLAALSKTSLISIATRPLGRPNRQLRGAILERRPDVLVVHNVYPQISPSDLRYAQRIGIPVVHVVHNYRHSCLAGTHFREGQPCNLCVSRRFASPGIRRSCYRGSRAQSLVLATSNAMYQRLWRHLDAYVAISSRIADYLVAEGFPPDRIHTIPSPVEWVDADSSTGRGALYAGRLEPEKGVELLLDAWRLLPAELRKNRVLHIAGHGSLSDLVLRHSRLDSSIVFHGLLTHSALEAVARECGVSVVPSIWNEPFGRAAAQSLMRGHALIVTDRGALADFAGDGIGRVVEPTVHALSRALEEALNVDNRISAERGPAIALERFGSMSVATRYLAIFQSFSARGTDVK
jgi:glycosyltransferase involved in cell wall biosynthesis